MSSIYTGSFRTVETDYDKGNLVNVRIESIKGNDREEIKLTDVPITLSLNGGGNIFEPLKPMSATIRIFNKGTIYSNMFSRSAVDVKVYIEQKGNVIFKGYVSPNLYTQGWQYANELDIECISPLSYSKYIDFGKYDRSLGTVRWYDIIKECVLKMGHYDKIYWHNALGYDENGVNANFLFGVYQNLHNFFDDDDENTPWKVSDVLKEFCKYLGISCVEYYGQLWFIDYDTLALGNKEFIEIGITNEYVKVVNLLNEDRTIQNDIRYKAGGQNISFEESYTKFTVKNNTYEPEELSGEDTYKPIPYYNGIDIDTFEIKNEFPGYYNPNVGVYLRTNSLDSPKSCAVLGNITNGVFYIQNNMNPQKNGDVEKVWMKMYFDNTHSLFPNNNPALRNPSAAENVKSTSVFNALTPHQAFISKIATEWCPNFGTSTTNINMEDMVILTAYHNQGWYLERQMEKYGNKANLMNGYGLYLPPWPLDDQYTWFDTISLIPKQNTKYYVHIDFSAAYNNAMVPFPVMSKNNFESSQNWKFIWCKLKVGDYYLGGIDDTLEFSPDNNKTFAFVNENGTQYSWTKKVSYVKVFFEENESYLKDDNKIISNVDWKMGINKSSGIAFELPTVAQGAKIELTFCTPHPLRMTPLKKIGTAANNYTYYEDEGCNIGCAFIKGLKLSIIASDLSNLAEDEEKKDYIYTNTDYESGCELFDDIELKVNTQDKKRPYSYSSLMRSNGSVSGIFKLGLQTLNTQECNLIAQYYKHYSSPKYRYNCTLNWDFGIYSILTEIPQGHKKYIVNGFDIDVRQNAIDVELIEL